MGDPIKNHGGIVAAFKFHTGRSTLEILDQTLLPKTIEYVDVPGTDMGHLVIKNMLVRGAPCIAAVGCLSLIVELNHTSFYECGIQNTAELIVWIKEKSEKLLTSRPTAVNLRNALSRLVDYAERIVTTSITELVARLTSFCSNAIEGGKKINRRLGDHGASEILRVTNRNNEGVVVLTHCNTGSLATVGYGTALGIIRSLHGENNLAHAYCTETRPYNQGSRLTAWELVQERFPATLIADSMIAYLFATKRVDAIVVGADRVASNGDTANKIGTLQLAVLAQHFEVPFYVAAPAQSVDLSLDNLEDIKVEERPANELRCLGGVELAPEEINVWNPCFDVTPGELITGIVTEFGVCKPENTKDFIKSSWLKGVDDDYMQSSLF